MAGGTFKNSIAKVRPGTYVNVVNGRQRTFATTERGTAIIPLVGYDYGPRDTFLRISNESPDKYRAQLGRSIYDDNEFMVMLRLIMQNATYCYVYIPDDGGAQASASVTMGAGVDKSKVNASGGNGDEISEEMLSIIKNTEPEEGGSKLSDSDYGRQWLINALQIGASKSTVLDNDTKMAIYSLGADGSANTIEAKLNGDGPRNVTYTITLGGTAYTFTVSQKTGNEEVAPGGTLTVQAKYKGTRGNAIKVVCAANPVSGYDVSVYLDNEEIEEFEKIQTIEDLKDVSEYVDFTGEGDLSAFASLTLSGGSDPEVEGSSKKVVTTFLDRAEKIRFNTMAFPIEDGSLQAALLTKIRYMRETIGWKCQAVAPNMAADYEGIINLTNSFVYDGKELTTAQACAWLAGARAGADYTTSLTYKAVSGATKVVGELTNEEAIEAIKKGETFFTAAEDDGVILEYDINSLVTFTDTTPPQSNKNRPLTVYDSWCNDCLDTFVPGNYSNNSDGWTVIEGLGAAMLKAYQEDGAITNVDLDNDFKVDREKSIDDSIYITAGLQAVDSADKYYITTIAR